jgi:hypothetical protein
VNVIDHSKNLLVLFCIASALRANIGLQGTVLNPFALPIPGATVTADGNTVKTDSSGVFYIGTSVLGVRNNGMVNPPLKPMRLNGWNVTLLNPSKKEFRALVFDCTGRTLRKVALTTEATTIIQIDVSNGKPLPSGMYPVRFDIGTRRIVGKAIATGKGVSWQLSEAGSAFPLQPLSRKAGITTVIISAPGYETRSFDLEQQSGLGLEFMLYYPEQKIPPAVTVRHEEETNILSLPGPTSAAKRLVWAGNSLVKSYESVNDRQYTKQSITYPLIWLENGKISVAVSPELGGRIIYMIDKTKSPERQMFATPASSGLLQCTKTQNFGGIKPSFPSAENSTGALGPDGNYDYRAGYFILNHPDGAVSVIMNMRFDYNQTEENAAFRGRYGDRPLITVATLRPGCSYLDLSYTADNTNPERRNDRIWNDAILPYSPSSWIFPTKYAMDHCAASVWEMQISGGVGHVSSPWESYFAVYPQYGFSGAYYAGDDASHLCVADPKSVPGCKLYAHPEIPELWRSTNPLFEAPNSFVNAWEPTTMKLRYFMTRGMGTVTYANDHVAITAKGNQFFLTSPSAGRVSVYDHGNASAPLLASVYIGPDTVLSGTFSSGLRVVATDGRELCDEALPLQYADNRSRFDEVKALADLNGCAADLSPANLDTRFAYHYELEEVSSWGPEMSSLASLLAIDHVQASDNADTLISMAFAAYRSGLFDVVNRYLSLVGDRKPAHSAYLRALMALEQGQPADFTNAPIESRYFIALARIHAGDNTGAVTELDALLNARPDAIRPRILRTYLTRSLRDGYEVLKRVPGSLELWVVLRELGYPGADATVTALLNQNQIAETRAADFLKEITQGIWRHERRFEYDRTWFENVNLPAFPDSLPYQ